MAKITVIIPVFNSEKSLTKLCRRLEDTLKLVAEDYEIIFVDDGSKDNSYLIMTELHTSNPKIKAIKLKHNYGQQNAIMCGLHYAAGDYIVIMDDDIQNPPEEIKKLLWKIDEGFDIVYGIPKHKLHKTYRHVGAVMRDLLFKLLFSAKPKKIKVSSFRILRRSLVEKIKDDKTSFVYLSAIIFKGRVKAANIEVTHFNREYGRSNYTLRKLTILYFRIILNYAPLLSRFADTSQPQFEIQQCLL